MKKIFVEKIENGMTLGRDVCGASGSILLSKGASLSQSIGKRLKNWGITFVYVEGDEVSEQEENSIRTSPEEIKVQLMEKFSDCRLPIQTAEKRQIGKSDGRAQIYYKK
jgi:hypothetical protein